MNKIILLFLIFILTFATATQAESYDSFNRRLGNSDLATPVHYGLGAAAGGLTTYYLPKKIPTIVRFGLGVLAGTLAGCVSESLDKSWDNKDLAQWVGGGVIGATFVVLTF